MGDMRRIFLAHAVTTGRGGYRANLERCRLLALGAESLDPAAVFLRDLGRTPEDDPGTGHIPAAARVAELARRLICGDARQHRGNAATTCLEPATALWVVSERCPEVDERIGWATQAGIPIRHIDADEQAFLYAKGIACLRSMRPAECEDNRSGPDEDAETAPFRSAAGVIWTWVRGAAAVLGARSAALPSGSGGGRNGDRLSGRLERAGLKLAAAEGVMDEARSDRERWLPLRTDALLLAIYGQGMSYQDAATASGIKGAMEAWRRHEMALAAIRDALGRIRERNERIRAEREQAVTGGGQGIKAKERAWNAV